MQGNNWDILEQNCLIPTVSHSRVWLETMFEHLGKKNAKLITAGTNSLNAITALETTTILTGRPIPIAQTWDTGFLFSGTPLISCDNPQVAITDLLLSIEQEMNVRAVLLKKIQCHSGFDQALEQLAKNNITNHHLLNIHQRAALNCDGVFDSWYSKNFSRKRRKEYRRLRNRLVETGAVKFTTWQPEQPVDHWIENFLALEKSGWKGRNGTAVACSKSHTSHLKDSLSKMAQNGSLLFWQITLDGKPVASMFGFRQHNQVWLGKMAYDETLSQYSPGVLVILDATKDLFARKDITMADSSAEPDHPMINNIWRDRITVADYLIATPNTSNTTFSMLIALEAGRLNTRNIAKAIYQKIRKGLNK